MCVNVKYVFYYHFNFSFRSRNVSSLEYGDIKLYSSFDVDAQYACKPSLRIEFNWLSIDFSFVRVCAVYTAVAAVVQIP